MPSAQQSDSRASSRGFGMDEPEEDQVVGYKHKLWTCSLTDLQCAGKTH